MTANRSITLIATIVRLNPDITISITLYKVNNIAKPRSTFLVTLIFRSMNSVLKVFSVEVDLNRKVRSLRAYSSAFSTICQLSLSQ